MVIKMGGVDGRLCFIDEISSPIDRRGCIFLLKSLGFDRLKVLCSRYLMVVWIDDVEIFMDYGIVYG